MLTSVIPVNYSDLRELGTVQCVVSVYGREITTVSGKYEQHYNQYKSCCIRKQTICI